MRALVEGGCTFMREGVCVTRAVDTAMCPERVFNQGIVLPVGFDEFEHRAEAFCRNDRAAAGAEGHP